MNNEDFKTIVEGCIANINSVLANKSREYSSKDDKLHNFDKAKDLMRCKTKEFALLGMLNKHLVSVIDMIEKFEKTGELPTSNMIDEKIGDSINYFILLKACFYDDMIKAERKDPPIVKKIIEEAFNTSCFDKGKDIEMLKKEQAAIANSMYNNPRKRLVVENLRKMLKPLFVWLTDNNRFVDYEKIKGILNTAELERDHVPDEFIKDVVVAIRLLDLPIEMQDRRNEIIADILKPPLTKFKVGDDVVPIFFAAWVDKWQVGRDMTIATIDIDTEDKTIYYYGMFEKCEEKDCFKTKEEAQRECDNRNNTNAAK